jgi:hypothetical protein
MSNRELQEYRDRLATGGGLLAREWDHFDSLERQLDPDAYKARRDEGARQAAMASARRLSTDDLKAILAERNPIRDYWIGYRRDNQPQPGNKS